MDGKNHRVRLENGYKDIKKSIKIIENWFKKSTSEHPALILNKNCQSCQFQQICQQQAEKEGNLSLLDRMSAKAIQKYNKRGIFTIQQLSYLFKPRRRHKKRKNAEPVKHSLELQALALREQKVYIQEMPDLIQHPVELFLDIEGIPDQRFYYLIGLLVCKGEKSVQHSFWADTLEEEKTIWKKLLTKLNEYPKVPIYCYGNYEIRALNELSKRYSNDINDFKKRLININKIIFGKIYFPTFSNSLKRIGVFLDFKWTSQKSSGLQSLVWRYQWEENHNKTLKRSLINYNSEDCQARKLLTYRIFEIQGFNKPTDNIEFADRLKKISTESGEEIHQQLESILNFAHSNYNQNKLNLNNKKAANNKGRKIGPKYGHPGHHKTLPKADKSIYLDMRLRCPKCEYPLLETEKIREKIIVDLIIKKNGFQKKVIKYLDSKGYCEKCRKSYDPSFIDDLGPQLLSHAFRAWLVYQRLFLRLPLNVISEEFKELFHETISQGTLVNYIKSFAEYYSDSQEILLSKILDNSFIHVDETPINIRGINQYVWTFTDGNHVIFKFTETREANIAHETLLKYEGILVSDFYAGYDSIPCKQQKCWVHLLRDINDDLWKSPFDSEYEAFILELKELILPIFEAIDKYGLKKRNLGKYRKKVDRFYKNHITSKNYHSELSIKYQKRFERYQESLFTFLEYDSIPWHNNNTAERALRHIAIQKKISGSFFETGANSYLALLGIMQTCRFQEKSFLKFLVSGEKDVDAFKSPKIKKRTQTAKSHT